MVKHKKAKPGNGRPKNNSHKQPKKKASGKRDENGHMKGAEYEMFKLFVALPREERKKALDPEYKGDLETQGDFAKRFSVNQGTLSEWKDRPGFWDEVSKVRREFFKERIGSVIGAVAKKAERTGDAAEGKLFLQYAGELKEEHDPGAIAEPLARALDKIASVLK